MDARTLLPVVFLTPLLSTIVASAQHTSTVPSNYKGPVLNSICIASIDGSSGMTSAIFAVSGYYRFDAERAWAAYALTQNANKPLKGTRCVWSTTPIDPAKVQISSQNGGQVKQTNWKFNPQTMLPAGAPVTAQTASSADAANPKIRSTAVNSQANAALASGVSTASTSTGAAQSATSAASSSTATPTAGVASINQTAQQSMQDAKSSATTAVTGSVNTVTTTTVQSVTGALTNGIQGFLNKKKKDPAASTPATSAGTQSQASVGSTPTGPATLVASGTAPQSPADMAHPTQAPSGGMNFVFCHLAASGSEYISEIFPTTLSAGSTLESAFWQFIGTQYHLTNIPYRNNVGCVHSATEAESVAAVQTLKSTVSQRGINASHEVDTGWTYSGAAQ